MTTEKGDCPECFSSVRLDDQRCAPHPRPPFRLSTYPCDGIGQVALDELNASQETLVELIGATIDRANTSRMAEKNRRRCALAVYWTLRQRGLVW